MVGVIDSGSGGVNVILECVKYYNEDFIYLIDNKNCPYGNKKKQELLTILEQNINTLLNMGVDVIILACNTISALVDHNFLLKYKTPILKTKPSVKNIKNLGENTLIFATKNTIKNSKHLKLIKINYPKIKFLFIKDLPKYIDNYLCENSKLNYNILNKKINNKFTHKNVAKNKYKNIKQISLGCTHFKHIKQNLNNIFNNKILFFECEKEVAKNSKWVIRKNKKKPSVKIILTQKNDVLEVSIKKMFLGFDVF